MEVPLPPDDQELRNVIDKLAQFVARNGPDFENMTMEKQKDNPKFSFLFGGEFYTYYKYKLAVEQQQYMCKQQGQDVDQAQQASSAVGSLSQASSLNSPQSASALEEMIQQSQWNVQQQEQQLITLRQEQIAAAISNAIEQQLQNLLTETQLDVTEFDNLLQPIIDTCTKDAISVSVQVKLLTPFFFLTEMNYQSSVFTLSCCTLKISAFIFVFPQLRHV
ncbi:calcium homeostasis endoplasmic reticulum protein-like [Protopterus annectens]|uniref:calcium homeostasis endoplasmic reticulum protein-like n=1 Tax=Protopterus annectens TaxID=7888 RepID=UPI001CFB7E65|nr:calcium homeostasis endoplasmic reticulum protein-like [Protopterus annectens]